MCISFYVFLILYPVPASLVGRASLTHSLFSTLSQFALSSSIVIDLARRKQIAMQEKRLTSKFHISVRNYFVFTRDRSLPIGMHSPCDQ